MTMKNDHSPQRFRLALTLGGGGARAAYQVGVLRAIAKNHPGLALPLLCGVSAGAINIAHLANFEGSLTESMYFVRMAHRCCGGHPKWGCG
jgi:NTE family protein